jgi:hypothetical protein
MILRTRSHPGTAAVLSFVFNGLGQIYNGQIAKGLLIVSLSSFSLLIFIIGSIFIGLWAFNKIVFQSQFIWGVMLFAEGMVFICLLGIYSILDAYKTACKK